MPVGAWVGLGIGAGLLTLIGLDSGGWGGGVFFLAISGALIIVGVACYVYLAPVGEPDGPRAIAINEQVVGNLGLSSGEDAPTGRAVVSISAVNALVGATMVTATGEMRRMPYLSSRGRLEWPRMVVWGGTPRRGLHNSVVTM